MMEYFNEWAFPTLFHKLTKARGEKEAERGLRKKTKGGCNKEREGK